ncbi:MAG: NAD(P)-dependent oxidoreductase [Gammaproteobacteria bacterium]|nr:NAD(P)-dependent oxidoreductase [Gammaproteobacteria bacterium]
MTKATTNAVFGLGSMGYGVGQSLLRAGQTVYGFDVVEAQVARLVDEGAKRGTTAEAGPHIDAVVAVVLNAAQLEDVLFGPNGIVQHMRKGTCVVACPTVAPSVARDLAGRCAELGVHYLDAPISGGAAKSAQGKLSVMASGSIGAFEAARPTLNAISETVFELGDQAGAGSAMKAVNQLLAGVHIATMAEAMTFGMTQGIDPARLVEVISQCAGTSWMFENRAPHVVNGDYTPHSAVNIWPKDLGIVLDIAREATFSTPMTAAALQQFLAAAGSGLGTEDDAAVAKVYARNANLELPS